MRLPPLLTPEDVSEVLGVSIASLKRWRRQGTGPKYTRIESQIRYRQEDLHDYIEARTTEPKQRHRR